MFTLSGVLVKVRATLRDAERDVTVVDESDVDQVYLEDGAQEFIWTEGNFSCDCNRSIFIGDQVPGYEKRPCNTHENQIELVSLVRADTGESLL